MTTEDNKREALLDPKKMDGPSVKWAPNDILRGNPRAFLTYHVMSAGYGYLTPVGAVVGGLTSLTPLKSKLFPRLTTTLQVAGTSAFGAGVGGMVLGLAAMYGISVSKNPKLPFDDDGIQMRVNGLSHNFKVRVMDVGVWSGLVSAGALMVLRTPVGLGLSSGALGVAQGLALGSTVGSLASITCISVTKSDD